MSSDSISLTNISKNDSNPFVECSLQFALLAIGSHSSVGNFPNLIRLLGHGIFISLHADQVFAAAHSLTAQTGVLQCRLPRNVRARQPAVGRSPEAAQPSASRSIFHVWLVSLVRERQDWGAPQLSSAPWSPVFSHFSACYGQLMVPIRPHAAARSSRMPAERARSVSGRSCS